MASPASSHLWDKSPRPNQGAPNLGKSDSSRTGPVWCKFHACKSGPLLEESLIWENRAMPKFGLF